MARNKKQEPEDKSLDPEKQPTTPTPEETTSGPEATPTAATGEPETAPYLEGSSEAEQTPPLAPVKHRKVNAHVRHYFTPEEKSELGDDVAQAVVTKKTLEDELSTIKANFKSDIAVQEEHINKISRLIHAGYEMRVVACQEYRDYENKKVLTIRDDTVETVKERPMTLDESQHFIDFEAFEAKGEESGAEETAAPPPGEGGEEPPGPGEGEGDQTPPPPRTTAPTMEEDSIPF